jgi:hypothetical protein
VKPVGVIDRPDRCGAHECDASSLPRPHRSAGYSRQYQPRGSWSACPRRARMSQAPPRLLSGSIIAPQPHERYPRTSRDYRSIRGPPFGNRRLRPKSASSRFPSVHGADLEGQQRGDLTRSPRGPCMTALCALLPLPAHRRMTRIHPSANIPRRNRIVSKRAGRPLSERDEPQLAEVPEPGVREDMSPAPGRVARSARRNYRATA